MKKKILVVLLFFFTFFISINVNAVSNKDLSNLLLESIPANNKICVYATNDFKAKDMINNPLREEFEYLVIVFSKNGDAYEATDYTFSVKDATFKPNVYLLPSISGGSQTFPTNNCNDYYPYIQSLPTSDYNFFIADSKTVSETKYFYQYNKTATELVTKNTSTLEEGSSLENCSYTVGNDSIRLVSYVAGDSSATQNNYFTTNYNNHLACPATTSTLSTSNGNYYTRRYFDVKNFDCGMWKLVVNPYYPTMDSQCYYYLVDKKEETHEEVGEKVEGEIVTVYMAYNSSKAEKINIKKTASGQFDADFANSGKHVIISNLSQYSDIFSSGETDNFPTWINLSIDDVTYTLSDTKDTQFSKINYICQEKISTIFPPGEDPDITCVTLFGSDFLKFLNSNVITIVRLGIPLLLILFTTFDFAKVVFVDDKEGIQKAGKRFGKRIVASILVYLIPAILIFLVRIIGADKVDECSDFLDSLETEQTE